MSTTRPPLDKARFLRARELFDRVAELPRADRTTVLDAECGGDPALRAQVEGWLARDEDSAVQDSLEQSGQPLLADWLAEREAEQTRRWIGRRIGPYTVEQVLGQGGMGVVLAATHADGRAVALKLIRPEQASAELQRRFAREFRLLAKLDDPGIVQPLDFGVSPEGLHYLALERIDGRELGTLLPELGLRRRVELLEAAARSVGAAHRLGIIHRDLKPSNLMVDRAGRVRVLDFGIAKDIASKTATTLTATGDLLFTPRYAAPEQRALRPATTATDVYALGTMLREWLAEPDDGADAMPPSGRRRLAAICAAATSDEPQRRHADGSALAADLQRVLRGVAPGWRSVAHPWRGLLRAARRPRAAATALAALLCVGALLGYQHWQATRIDAGYAITRSDLAELTTGGRERVRDALAMQQADNRDGALIVLDELTRSEPEAIWPPLLRLLLTPAAGPRQQALGVEVERRLARHPDRYGEALSRWQRTPQDASAIAAALAERPDAWRLRLAQYESAQADGERESARAALDVLAAADLPPMVALDLAIDSRLWLGATAGGDRLAARPDLQPFRPLMDAAAALAGGDADAALKGLEGSLDIRLASLARRALRLSALAAGESARYDELGRLAERWRQTTTPPQSIDAALMVAYALSRRGQAQAVHVPLQLARGAAQDALQRSEIDAAEALLEPKAPAEAQAPPATFPSWTSGHAVDWLRRWQSRDRKAQ